MSNPITAGAVVYAKDIGRVSQFYSRVAGLEKRDENDRFVVLESSSFQLVVVATPARIAAHIQIASPPVRREDTAIKLVFLVPSIAEARLAAAEAGGALNGTEREWQFQGARVCDGHDPEGNVFQLREKQA